MSKRGQREIPGVRTAYLERLSRNRTPTLISNWALEPRADVDPFKAPEICPLALSGEVEGRSGRVITSPVAKVDGLLVTTESGSIYVLGEMAPAYRELLDKGPPWDPANPLAIRKGATP